MLVVNISCYKFVTLTDREVLKAELTARCQALGLLGTILLAPEGINVFLAGSRATIDAIVAHLRADPRFADLAPKESLSAEPPFKRMRVRLKKEIITMKHPLIRPEAGRAPSVAAATLKQWLDRGCDDAGRPVVMLDTRNDYEVAAGSFDNAVDYDIGIFSEFPPRLAEHRADYAGKTVVSFCTGGIRCEKSTAFLRAKGFDEVYHLEGGILKYLETVPEAQSTWQGECFVFDERVSVGHGLHAGDFTLCRSCRDPLSAEDRASPLYERGVSCPHCHDRSTEAQKEGYRERQRQVDLAEARHQAHIGVRQPGSA